jgi:hypothetical protein
MQGHNTIKPNLRVQICQERAAGERYLSQSVSAQAARAAQILLDGKSPLMSLWELRQVKRNEDGTYQTTLAEILRLICASRGEDRRHGKVSTNWYI